MKYLFSRQQNHPEICWDSVFMIICWSWRLAANCVMTTCKNLVVLLWLRFLAMSYSEATQFKKEKKKRRQVEKDWREERVRGRKVERMAGKNQRRGREEASRQRNDCKDKAKTFSNTNKKIDYQRIIHKKHKNSSCRKRLLEL